MQRYQSSQKKRDLILLSRQETSCNSDYLSEGSRHLSEGPSNTSNSDYLSEGSARTRGKGHLSDESIRGKNHLSEEGRDTGSGVRLCSTSERSAHISLVLHRRKALTMELRLLLHHMSPRVTDQSRRTTSRWDPKEPK